MVGEGAPILVRRALQEARQLNPSPGKPCRYMKIYDRRLMNHTVPYEGIVESLGVQCVADRWPF